MKNYLIKILNEAILKIGSTENILITLESPRQIEHGDLATNIAMNLAKPLRKNPRAIAEEILLNLNYDNSLISSIEIAGAGFINFKFTDKFFQIKLSEIIAKGDEYGKSNIGNDMKTNVEYVSANPTGPLHTGHAIGAALGDTIANLLEWTGYKVTREYYFNNAGNQMRKLALSVQAKYLELLGLQFNWKEEYYQGEYIIDIAKEFLKINGDGFFEENEANLDSFRFFAEKYNFDRIIETLKAFNVNHEVFYNEDTLYSEGKIKETIDDLTIIGMTYEKDGALWLTFKEEGQNDRVIVKSTGEPTYRLPDIAYHVEKFKRGYEYIIDVFGADHIATAQDVKKAIKMLGYDDDKVKIVMNQMATFIEGGEEVKFSKRSGKSLTLDTMIEEFTSDVVRYFFVMRGVNTHLTFDIDLAREQSDKNPLFYLQYAHARVSSVLRHSDELDYKIDLKADLSCLKEVEEIDLIKELIIFPEIIQRASRELEPQILSEHLRNIASSYHKFYRECRIIKSEENIRAARLLLCISTKIALSNGLKILGVSAPDSMYKNN